jgi:aspartate dehydrogenase
MRKHPTSFKLTGYIAELNAQVKDEAVVLYDGPVRPLCSLAPNNVNTMAAASVAAKNLGLDQVIGKLVSDPT